MEAGDSAGHFMEHYDVLKAVLIGIIGTAIIISNFLTIATFLNFKDFSLEVINYYLLSLAVADLVRGMFIIPFSMYPAFVGEWMFGNLMCRVVGYVEVTQWCIAAYTLMWIAVDRYISVRKPTRYEAISATVQKQSRSKCWILFTWLHTVLLWCPPLLAHRNEAKFDKETLVCTMNLSSTVAYNTTVAALVLGPSVITIMHNYLYIASIRRKLCLGCVFQDKEFASALNENIAHPNIFISFLLVVSYSVSWFPYAIVSIYEYCIGEEMNTPNLHFTLYWLGVLNSAWKIVILLSVSTQFKLAFISLCRKALRCLQGRVQEELINTDNNE